MPSSPLRFARASRGRGGEPPAGSPPPRRPDAPPFILWRGRGVGPGWAVRMARGGPSRTRAHADGLVDGPWHPGRNPPDPPRRSPEGDGTPGPGCRAGPIGTRRRRIRGRGEPPTRGRAPEGLPPGRTPDPPDDAGTPKGPDAIREGPDAGPGGGPPAPAPAGVSGERARAPGGLRVGVGRPHGRETTPHRGQRGG